MSLAATDPQIAELIAKETQRQHLTLELIASENHVSQAVMEAAGSVLTNKYAEGYPGARYYGGCEYYDQIENLAIDRAKQLFGARFANVQPHSGANANLAAFMAMMQPGDPFLGIQLELWIGSVILLDGPFFIPVILLVGIMIGSGHEAVISITCIYFPSAVRSPGGGWAA